MFSPDLFLRLPPAAVMLVLSSITRPVLSQTLPRQTTTLEHRELDVLPWPLPTPPPGSPLTLEERYAGELDDQLVPRQLNSVCGYIGGDPALPATCSAGSHCVVDAQHSAIGCCPDTGACTTGVFTGCVDAGSGPQTIADPYIFSCSGSDVCYQNKFGGGFFQYGCGSSPNMGATVAPTASGQEAIRLSSLSVAMTEAETPLAEPTTLGTVTFETSESSTNTESATETSSSKSTNVDDRLGSSVPTATESAADSDPGNGSKGSKDVGAIVAGTIGGIIGVVVVLALIFFLLRRKKRSPSKETEEQDSQYISSPVMEINDKFEPFDANARGFNQPRIAPPPPPRDASPYSSRSHGSRKANEDEQFISESPYWSADEEPGRALTGDNDRTPLAREPHGGYASDWRPSDEDAPPGTATSIYSSDTYSIYPGPRRGGGGGVLWQQNREQSRNPSWL